eukprot:CAMPEP_0170543068 /NCGR_PEP_ID=MMETSP0211-20121228/2308_1 /TAXON_ID=311385 /ORGANISM="Pseudokeronopsis sp., Strain OXSARD2" /LENGTH=89 /DNA_ID=CAMNT_0010846349 /DNA_START=924 /DNA_END=1189 /DNA_ORIENTATION=+
MPQFNNGTSKYYEFASQTHKLKGASFKLISEHGEQEQDNVDHSRGLDPTVEPAGSQDGEGNERGGAWAAEWEEVEGRAEHRGAEFEKWE